MDSPASILGENGSRRGRAGSRRFRTGLKLNWWNLVLPWEGQTVWVFFGHRVGRRRERFKGNGRRRMEKLRAKGKDREERKE
jgi:hypothetical protein